MSAYPFPLFWNGFATPEVDLRRRDVVRALVVALVMVVIDQGIDLGFEITRRDAIFQQDLALQGLMSVLCRPAGYCAASLRGGIDIFKDTLDAFGLSKRQHTQFSNTKPPGRP
ncbi:MAG: hypothetical protein HRU33_00720 [Rhodobacteraceae bacterium]|nr:hypothetical protein [Paracoccaceae bacterium]